MAEIASAFVTIAPSAKGFGSKLNSEVGGSVRSSGSSLGKTFGKMFAIGAGVIAAAGIGNLLKGSIDEAREAQKVSAQTNAVLKSTGGIAGITADQVGKMAGRLSAVTGVDDEVIQSGENMLLTFTNVRNEVGGKFVGVFDQATITIQDMAAAFGGDATSNAKILGKALNDPVKGVSALTRVGVTFTDQQKEQIKTMTESGNVVGAQKIILKELAKETKGSAEAQATAGDKASVALGNLKETIGTALLPVIDRLANIFTTKIAPAVTTFIGQLQSGEGAGGKVADVFSRVGDVLGTVFGFINQNRTVSAVFIGSLVAMTVAFAAFNLVVSANPISLVIIGIAALAAGLVYAYKHSEKFRAVVDAVFGFLRKYVPPIISYVVGFVKDHWRLLIAIIGGPLGIIVGFVITHFDKIKSVVSTAASFVVGQAKQFGKFASLVVDHVGKVVKFFRDLPGKIKGFLTSLPGELKTIGGQIIQGLVDGIKAAAGKVADAVQAIINKIPKKIRQIMGIASPSKVTTQLGQYIGDGLAKGIADRSDKVGDAVDKVGKKLKEKISKLRDSLSSIRSDFASLVEPIASNFTQGLFEFDTASAFSANLTAVKGTLTTLLANFKTLIAEGLKPSFLYSLFQSGGPGLINSLAGLDAATAQGIGSQFSDVMSLSDQLGANVAGATDKGAALENQTQRLERKLDKLINHVDKAADRTGDRVNGAASGGRRRGK